MQQGATLTQTVTAVSNGLFISTLDFGNQFLGADRWLEIAVRTNGGGAFSTLAPRQPLTPTPYAIFAGKVNASGISGTLAPGNIANGTITTLMLANGVLGTARIPNLDASKITGTFKRLTVAGAGAFNNANAAALILDNTTPLGMAFLGQRQDAVGRF